VRARAAGRADEDALSLVPGSFEVGYVAEDGSAHRAALTDARAVRFEATAPSPVTGAIASSVSAISSSVAPAASAGRMSLSDIATGHGRADAGGMGERVMAGWGCPAGGGSGGDCTRRSRPGAGGSLMPPGRDGKPRRIPARAPGPPTGTPAAPSPGRQRDQPGRPPHTPSSDQPGGTMPVTVAQVPGRRGADLPRKGAGA